MSRRASIAPACMPASHQHRLSTCFCRVDLEFMRQRVDSTVIERLEEVANTPFKRISYTEAVDLLLKAIKEGKKFEFEVGSLISVHLF